MTAVSSASRARGLCKRVRECPYQFKTGEDEKSPTFVLLPTGERSNRIFRRYADREDPAGRAEHLLPGPGDRSTGTFFIMAGSLPARGHAATSKDRDARVCRGDGKPNLYQKPDGGNLVSVRVESITAVDKETRDLWVVDTTARTLTGSMHSPPVTNPDILKAKEHYPTLDPAVYRKIVYDALAQIKM